MWDGGGDGRTSMGGWMLVGLVGGEVCVELVWVFVCICIGW